MTILQACLSLPRHIRKGVLIRQNNAPDLCVTAVGCQQFCKEWRKRQRRFERNYQRWSPREHILKSLGLASKVKSLDFASKPKVIENCPVLGSRTALFIEPLKLSWKTSETSRKILEDIFVFLFWRSAEIKFLKTFF